MEHLLNGLLIGSGINVILLIVGWLVGRYITPWLHNPKHPSRLEWATEMARIAKTTTAELVRMFPDATWDDIAEKVVLRVIEKMDIPLSKLKDPTSKKVAGIRAEVTTCLMEDHNIT